MGIFSSLFVFNSAAPTPDFLSHLDNLPAGEAAANLAALSSAMEMVAAEDPERERIESFCREADVFLHQRGMGEFLHAFGSRQRSLYFLRTMRSSLLEKARAILRGGARFSPSAGPLHWLEPNRGQFALEAEEFLEWERLALRHVVKARSDLAAMAFEQAAAATEMSGLDRHTALNYKSAAVCWQKAGRFMEAAFFYAVARWHARLGEQPSLALTLDAGWEEALTHLFPSPVSVQMVRSRRALDLAFKSNLRGAKNILEETALWFSLRKHPWAAGHIYKLAGDILLRGERWFSASIDYALASQELEKAADVAGMRTVETRHAIARASQIGPQRHEGVDWKKLAALFGREARQFHHLGETSVEIQFLQERMDLLEEKGRYADARRLANRIASLYLADGQPLQAASAIHERARLWMKGGGKMKTVAGILEKVHHLYASNGQHQKAAEVLSDWASFLMEKMEFLKAARTYRRLANVCQRHGGADNKMFSALADAAKAFEKGGDTIQARQTLRTLLRLARQKGDSLEEWSGLIELGTSYARQGMFKQALPVLWRSYKISAGDKDSRDLAIHSLVIISYYLKRSGLVSESERIWKNALELAQRNGENFTAEGHAHALLADYLRERGWAEEAVDHYARAAEALRHSGDSRTPFILEKLGQIEMERGQWRSAALALHQARSKFLEANDLKGEERAAKLLRRLGQKIN